MLSADYSRTQFVMKCCGLIDHGLIDRSSSLSNVLVLGCLMDSSQGAGVATLFPTQADVKGSFRKYVSVKSNRKRLINLWENPSGLKHRQHLPDWKKPQALGSRTETVPMWWNRTCVNYVVVAFQELYVPVLVVSFTAVSVSVCHDKLIWGDRLRVFAVEVPVLMLQGSCLMLSKVQLDQRPYFHGKHKGNFCDMVRSLCCTGMKVLGTARCVQERPWYVQLVSHGCWIIFSMLR